MSSIAPGSRVGPYELLAPLGAGGMGEVWRARDCRLGRELALKRVHGRSPADRERIWREARIAANLSHPNVCQIFDVLEEDGEIFLAFELLEGETLDARLARGPLPAGEAVEEMIAILAALGALHERGYVHRDLKPANIFRTGHGPKLLDFGLALRMEESAPAELRLTRPGVAVGTPRYMSPEQWSGARVGPAADLFACGAILYEMLAGAPAFPGDEPVAVFTAIARGTPPRALSGGAVASALERIVHRALRTRAEERYASADEMAEALRNFRFDDDTTTLVGLEVRAVTRLVVVPFRMLRPDPELDFLGAALADSLSAALRGLSNLVVRSSRIAAGQEGDDPRAIAVAADADAVLVGTLLRARDRVRLSTELIDATTGSVRSTARAEARLDDLFDLQDELARQIFETLRVPLDTGDRQQLAAAAPAAPAAYQLYLKATGLAVSTGSTSALIEARALLEQCVDADPGFAPAWARLGRIHRVIAKYGHGEPVEHRRLARKAFETALALAPDHALVHNLYTHFEIEDLKSPVSAMLRLLGRIDRHGSDPDLFAGLVTACRYPGLLDASLAAHERAKRLDPAVRTSVQYTFLLAGDWQKALDADDEPVGYVRQWMLPMLGRSAEAIASFPAWRERVDSGVEIALGEAANWAVLGDRERVGVAARQVLDSGFDDPEGIYLVARNLAHVAERDAALDLIARAVSGGLTVPQSLELDPWLDPLRGEPRFAALVAEAEAGRRHAQELFEHAGGPRLLGL